LNLDTHKAAIAAGDAHAFGQWMIGAEPSLRLSLHSFASAVDTEAVVQEALLRIWQVAPKIRDDGKPNTLLRFGVRVARNLAISEVRKHGRTGLVEPDALERQMAAEDAVHTPAPPDPLLRQTIQQCKEQLPAKPKAALEARLSCQGGESDASLASSLSMRKNTFLQNFTRARTFLAQCLKRHGVQLEQELA